MAAPAEVAAAIPVSRRLAPDRRPAPDRLTPNGLTLIETMVALAVLGFILTIALPMISGGQGRSELRTAATAMSTALRAVRNRAVAENHEEIFLVDTDRARYRPAGGVAASLPPSIRLTLFTTTQEQLSTGIGAIRFYADGSSTGGGMTLTRGDAHTDILVDWLTGRISLHDRHDDRRS
jgi:general secretion pathway protein H